MKCKICSSIIKEKAFSKPVKDKKIIFDYYYCSKCNCLFSDGMDKFTNKQYEDWYSYPEYLKYDNAGTAEYRRFRAIKEREVIAPKSKKILVHGSGASEVEKSFKDLGLEVWSTYSNYKEVNCNIDPSKLPIGYFDLIISNEVAEHWANPDYEFSLIERVLKKNGFFIGSTGITDNQLKKGKLEDWIYLDNRCLHAGHVMLWSWEAIDIMAKRYNLINKSIQGDNKFRSGMRVGITQAFIILQKI